MYIVLSVKYLFKKHNIPIHYNFLTLRGVSTPYCTDLVILICIIRNVLGMIILIL